jgi:hypothetical protein
LHGSWLRKLLSILCMHPHIHIRPIFSWFTPPLSAIFHLLIMGQERVMAEAMKRDGFFTILFWAMSIFLADFIHTTRE